MTTFTWKINSLQVLHSPEPNTVAMSNFTILGEDNGLTGSVTYSVNLLPADPANFTPFDQITEAMAVQWTKDALGERALDMEAEVQAQIEAQQVPVPAPAPLPWAAA